MLPLPRPRSSKLTTSAPALLTEALTVWNFAATAEAGLAMTTAATRAMTAMSTDLMTFMVVLPSWVRRPTPTRASHDGGGVDPGVLWRRDPVC